MDLERDVANGSTRRTVYLACDDSARTGPLSRVKDVNTGASRTAEMLEAGDGVKHSQLVSNRVGSWTMRLVAGGASR